MPQKSTKQEEKILPQKSVVKHKVPQRVTRDNNQIPQDLLEKLRELEINPSEQVIQAIKEHHISQAYGAAAHVENTWETINNPKSVFLYQLPKQPIEKLGQRLSDELIEKTKREKKAIELSMETPEYQAQKNVVFERIRRILGT